MNNTLRIAAVVAIAAFACGAQAQPGQVPTVQLPYGVSTVAAVRTPLSGPVVTLPVSPGVSPAPTPASVPSASAAPAANAAPTAPTAPSPN